MKQALAALVMLFAPDDAALRPGDHTRTLHVAWHERSYLVHVPPQDEPAAPMPVVLAFHGGGANAANMVVFSGLNDRADQAGFISHVRVRTRRRVDVHRALATRRELPE